MRGSGRLSAALAAVLFTGCGTRAGFVLSLGPGTAGGDPDGGPGAAGGGGAGDFGGGGAGGGAGAEVTPTTYYIGPEGSDGNPGTSPTAPWLTFMHALPVLAPGSTLVLLDGTYASATSGLLQVFCPMNAVDGTPAQPITVRAMNERQAFILGDGNNGPPIELSGCANWVLEGLHAEETDLPGEVGDEAGSVVVLTRCTNVVERRMLAAHPNRYNPAPVYVIAHGTSDALLEECEALDFHYYGFDAYDTTHTTLRRDYAHSRDTPDIPGGQSTSYPTRGDGGFLLTKSSFGLIENCVAEDVGDGFTIRGSSTAQGGLLQPQHDELAGDVSNGVSHAGFLLYSQCEPAKNPCNIGDEIVSDATVSNVVARGGTLGVSVEGGVDNMIANSSVFDVADTGVSLSLSALNLYLQSSAYVHTTLVSSADAAFGFHSTGQFNWSFNDVVSFGPTMSFVPKDNHLMMGQTTDPQLGGCLVFVPDASPLKATDIGANIVFESVDGQPTPTKLWDQTTGQFPCGAVVAGLNDASLVDVSCAGVGTRLHVGAMGCPIP
jgi:hypothetical protein